MKTRLTSWFFESIEKQNYGIFQLKQSFSVRVIEEKKEEDRGVMPDSWNCRLLRFLS